MMRPRNESNKTQRQLWLRLGRLRVGWVVEIGLVFAVILLFAEALGYGASLAKISPHPFWLPVLLFSFVYGFVPGLVATAVAVGLHWLVFGSQLTVGLDYYDRLLAFSKEPVLWFVTAAAISAYRVRQDESATTLMRKVEEYDVQRQVIAEYADTLRAHVGKLEHAAAIRSESSVSEFREVLVRLSAMHSGFEQDEALQRVCVLATGCSKATVFRRGRQGWTPAHSGSPQPRMDRLMEVRLEGLRDPQAFRTTDSKTTERPECVIAAPVKDRLTSEVQAVLLLEDCPFEQDMTGVLVLAGMIAGILAPMGSICVPAPGSTDLNRRGGDRSPFRTPRPGADPSETVR